MTEWYEYPLPDRDGHCIGAIHRYVRFTPEVRDALNHYTKHLRDQRELGIDAPTFPRWDESYRILTAQAFISGFQQSTYSRDDLVGLTHSKIEQVKHAIATEMAADISDPDENVTSGLVFPR